MNDIEQAMFSLQRLNRFRVINKCYYEEEKTMVIVNGVTLTYHQWVEKPFPEWLLDNIDF